MHRNLSALIRILTVFFIIGIACYSEAKTPDAVVKQKNAVVNVYLNDKNGKQVASGTGFIVDKSGIIATDCQIISKWFKKANTILRVEAGGIQFPLEDLISRRCENNLVLIKIDAADLPSVKLDMHYKPKSGENITVVRGIPGGGAIFTEATTKNILKQDKLIQTSLRANPKISGSPVFNSFGEVIGAIVPPAKKDKNINAALIKDIPNQIERYWKSISIKKAPPPIYQPPKEAKKTGDANEYFLLGCTYESFRSYSEAIEAYKESLRRDPNYSDAYINLGVVYYKLGKYSDAIEAFKEASKVQPDSLLVYRKLGTAYIIRGAYSEAVDAFRKATDIEPNNAEAHFNLGIAFFLTGDKTAAFEEYITLRDMDKERADILRDILVN
jgi:tetratricopeptide (TPR) repeat protein